MYIKYINILKKYINIYKKKYINIQNKYIDINKKERSISIFIGSIFVRFGARYTGEKKSATSFDLPFGTIMTDLKLFHVVEKA